MENLKHTTRVKELISGEVCMGTYGLVELEVRKLEQTKNDLLEALIKAKEQIEHLSIMLEKEGIPYLPSTEEALLIIDNAINKATK